jgi:rare lipoprotein A
LADRYTGRHIRHARHAAWLGKKRFHLRPTRQLLPTAAALTVAGVMIGAAGTAMQLHPPGEVGFDASAVTDPANIPPPDRNAMVDRASRDSARVTAATAATPTPWATRPSQPAAAVAASGSCDASYYDTGKRTANGEAFNPDGLTAAHRSLPFGSQVRVTNVANGKSVVVRINDRGPFVSGRCLDLSRGSFQAIANLGSGVIDVRYEVLIQDAT